ncbi:MAG: S4 domain-containing protein [Nanoarchaeota archaeon]
MHLKRQNIGKFWPVPRKGTKYLAVSTHDQKNSIPLIIVVRDVLGLVRTKKELKNLLKEKKIKINGKVITETNYPLRLFDVLLLNDKNYRVGLSKHKKIMLDNISDNFDKKTIKITGKKIIKGNKIQLNLIDGRNVIYKEKANVGDSVVFNFNNRNIEKVIKMEVGKIGFIIRGKHIGQKGKIEDIIERGGKKLAKINIGKKINVWVKNIIAMEEI